MVEMDRGRVRPTTTSRNMAALHALIPSRNLQPWFTACIFDIEHPCYGQLTPVKRRYPLISVMWPYHGLIEVRAHRGLVFFFNVDRCPSIGYSIGSRARVSLICSDQGQELIEVWIFLLYKCFSLLLRHGLLVSSCPFPSERNRAPGVVRHYSK